MAIRRFGFAAARRRTVGCPARLARVSAGVDRRPSIDRPTDRPSDQTVGMLCINAKILGLHGGSFPAVEVRNGWLGPIHYGRVVGVRRPSHLRFNFAAGRGRRIIIYKSEAKYEELE